MKLLCLVFALLIRASEGDIASKDVIIVGSGISGLAAARTLLNHNSSMYNVTVLEANPSRFGGRIHTEKIQTPQGDGMSVDVGASWIIGYDKENPITKLQIKYGLSTRETDWYSFCALWEDTGHTFTNHQLENGWKNFEKALWHLTKVRRIFKEDKSVGEVFKTDQALSSNLTDHAMCMYMRFELELEYGASIDNISTLLYSKHENFGDGERHDLFVDGYYSIVENLANGIGEEAKIKVKLDSIVTAVKWMRYMEKTKVTTASGEEYIADRVIVTVPVGVLKEKEIQFDPPLPDAKLQAIQNIGFIRVNKLILQFDEAFWPVDKEIFVLSNGCYGEGTMLAAWFNLYPLHKKPVLMAFLGGLDGETSELWSDEHLKNKGLEALRVLFGNETVNTRTVVGMIRTLWGNDPYTHGSYTYPAVGNTMSDWSDLAAPVCPYLYFAGEHTNFDYLATVHGAYLSGVRAATEIINDCKTSTASSHTRGCHTIWGLLFSLLSVTLILPGLF